MAEAIKIGSGATPAGAVDEQSAARAVREMFDEIAPRYDFLNHALSMNIDRLWWRRTARAFRHILSPPDACVLDLSAAPGHMSVSLRNPLPPPCIHPLLLSHPLL